MKDIIFLIILILVSSYVSATSYYFSNSGSDANNCFDETSACKTISKMNNLSLKAGDTVYFNNCGLWRSISDAYITITSGNSTANITYDFSSWGNCSNARIYGSYNASNADNWTCVGNICNTTFTIPYDVGNIIFNSTEEYYSGFGAGNKTYSYGALSQNRQFYYNAASDLLSVYFTGGGIAEAHSNIEIARRKSTEDKSMIDYSNKNNIVIKGGDFRYYGATIIGGIGTSSNQNHVFIIGNKVSWAGGVFQTGALRYGNGIDISLTALKIQIINNTVYQAYDAGVTYQAWSTAGTHHSQNILFDHNLITHSNRGIEIFSSNGSSSMINFSLKHNTVGFIGHEWRDNHTTDGDYPRALQLTRSPTNTTGWVILNNIFFNAKNREYVLGNFATTDWKGQPPSQDYNLYYNGDGGAGFINYNNTAYASLAAFKAAKPQEANGSEGDPLFVSDTYQPAYNSPACNMSSTGSYVGALPCADAPTTTCKSNRRSYCDTTGCYFEGTSCSEPSGYRSGSIFCNQTTCIVGG